MTRDRLGSAGRREFVQLLGGGLLLSSCGAVSALAAESAAGNRMSAGEPSATARGAALLRALHQVIDYPRILDDPFAVPIVGPDAAGLQAVADRGSPALRAHVAMRSRYAEDRLALALHRGVRQYVVLGAGLDTFAWRNPYARGGLRVFEVDHPATQSWKQARLQSAEPPHGLHLVPVDFERQALREQLLHHGFRFDRPAFFSMLGVVIYLTEEAVMNTMRLVASCAPGSEVVFSFSLPHSHLSEAELRRRQFSMAQVAKLGEPWLTFFDPDELTEKMRATGFRVVDVLTPPEANRTYFANRLDGLRVTNGHMMAARV